MQCVIFARQELAVFEEGLVSVGEMLEKVRLPLQFEKMLAVDRWRCYALRTKVGWEQGFVE